MQVADVEVRHARNRRSTSACGQTSWPQLASKYVLRELACLHQARAAECRLWLGRESREDHDESVARPGSERERLSAQSALQLFRHDILKRDAGLGIKIGAANKDHWAQIKGKFQMLPADRRATYEAQAQASRVEARAARKRRSLCQAAIAEKEVVRLSSAVAAGARPGGGHAGGGGAAAVDAAAGAVVSMAQTPAAPLSVSVLAGQGFDARNTHDKDTLMEVVQARTVAVGKRGQTDILGDEYPVSQQTLDEEDLFARNNHVQNWQRYNHFKAMAQTIAGPKDEGDVFPERVPQITRCGCLCKAGAPAEQLRMHHQVVAALAQVAQRYGSPNKLTLADPLLAFKVYHGQPRGLCSVRFALLSASSLRHAHHNSTQTFTMLACVEGNPPSDYMNLRLRLSVDAFVPPRARLRSPFHRQAFGSLQHKTEDEFATSLVCLKPPWDGDESATASQATIHTLRYHDIDLAEVITDGVDNAVGTVEVTGMLDGVPVMDAGPGLDGPGPVGGAPGPDFMDGLGARRRGRRAQQ